MNELVFIFSFKVSEANEAAYQEMLAQTLEITKKEEGTLMYEIFKDKNGVYCQHERYANEEALIAHAQNTATQLQQWFALTEVQQIISLGNISDAVIEQYQLKEVYSPFKRVEK